MPSSAWKKKKSNKKKKREKVREELDKNPPKASAFSTPSGRKDVTPEQPTAITSKKKHKNRNAGKQRSR